MYATDSSLQVAYSPNGLLELLHIASSSTSGIFPMLPVAPMNNKQTKIYLITMLWWILPLVILLAQTCSHIHRMENVPIPTAIIVNL
jgi:hypothetical protein